MKDDLVFDEENKLHWSFEVVWVLFYMFVKILTLINIELYTKIKKKSNVNIIKNSNNEQD